MASKNIFFISDMHLGHNNIIRFKDSNGDKLRPFDNLEEMHESLVTNWNKVVGPNDLVYDLGDVAFSEHALSWVGKMNGTKYLVRGNHDKLPTKSYLNFYEEIYGGYRLSISRRKVAILSHYPVHPDSVGNVMFNIHGHLHEKVVTTEGVTDPRYYPVSVEQTNFAPVPLEQIVASKNSGY